MWESNHAMASKDLVTEILFLSADSRKQWGCVFNYLHFPLQGIESQVSATPLITFSAVPLFVCF